MESAIAKIYHLMLEDTYKCSISATAAYSASYKEVNADKNVGPQTQEEKINFYRSLPEVLQKMLTFWKNAPSGKSWAVEKLTDVFCADIACNPHLLGEKDFAKFVNGFFDGDGKLLDYPDFVMDEVSKMLTSVLLSGKALSDDLQQTAFSLIRSPFDYGLISKGHRLHTVFQSFQKFLSNAITCDLMRKTNFDVSFALAISLISGHNYTRKSAKDFFVKIVKFAFEETSITNNDHKLPDNWKTTEVKEEAKAIVLKATNKHAEKLVSCSFHKEGSGTNSPQYDGSICENFCDLLCLCADASDEWCQRFDAQLTLQRWSLFDLMLSLMTDLKTRHVNCDHQLTMFCTQMLIKLTNLQDDKTAKEKNIEKLFDFIIRDLCQQSTENSPLELMQVSYAVLCQYDCNAAMSRTLLELSLLPLLSVLGVPLSCRQDLNPKLVERFAQRLRAESSGNSPLLIDQAVKMAFELDRKKIEPHSDLMPVLDYLTMRRKEFSSVVASPFLSHHNEIRNAQSLHCLLACFQQITHVLYNNQKKISAERMICLELYVEVLMNSTFKCHEHFQTVFVCFLAMLQRHGGGDQFHNRHLVSAVTAFLQLHMVSVNLTIRETAVKCVHELYLLADESVTQELADSNAIVSVWHCVNDKSESVVNQVMDFILCAAKREKLAGLLSHIQISQERLSSEIQNILLSNPWDSVKSTAFSILATICQPADLIIYAEVSLRLENHPLTLEVLRFMEKLFKNLTGKGKEGLEPLVHVLAQGWSDLLFSKVNAQDINAFRLAASILVNLHEFFMKPDVTQAINKMLRDMISKEDKIVGEEFQRSLEKEHARRKLLLAYWEELCMSLKQLPTRNEFYEGERGCESGEPPCKVQKIHENVSPSDLNEAEIFLCSTAKCDKDWAVKHYQHWLCERPKNILSDEDFVDSTKELPPMKVETKLFPSQELVHVVIGENEIDRYSQVVCLLTLVNIREVLSELDICAIHKEAHRSTDQYARNEGMILEDLSNQLETSFSRDGCLIKRQMAGTLISDAADLLECFLKSNAKNVGSLCESLQSLITRLSILVSSQRRLLEFMISKKKRVLVEKWTPNNSRSTFTLDAFLERFGDLQAHGISLKESYASATDLTCLFEMYVREQSNQTLKIQSDAVKVGPKAEIGNREEPSAPFSASLEFTMHSFKYQNSSSGVNVMLENIDSLQQSLDQMILESQKETESILGWLKKMCETTLFCLKKCENVEDNVQKMLTLVAKMDHWYNDENEDEFDDDNDPTLIDCF